jgi:rod shape-determining protein MreC
MIALTGARGRPRRTAASPLVRLLVLGLLAIGLMIVDQRTHALDSVRTVLGLVVYPIQYVASLPQQIGRGVGNLFAGRETLKEENRRLHREVVLMRATQQKFDAVLAENNRLRNLFVAAARVADRALIAELIRVDLDAFTRKLLVNKGSSEGVFVGQPVIDADGVMGQVTAVTPFSATVTLITDPGHAVPVQVQRNGLRAILFGTGAAEELDLPNLTATADIREGDDLITSGMGGRFPAGYPVARVTRIVSDPNESFLAITAEPVARLNHSKEVLLIWSGDADAMATAPAPEAAP